MTKEEIGEIIGIPFPELAELAHNPEDLEQIISIAYNEGIASENRRVHHYYHQMFLGYADISIAKLN